MQAPIPLHPDRPEETVVSLIDAWHTYLQNHDQGVTVFWLYSARQECTWWKPCPTPACNDRGW